MQLLKDYFNIQKLIYEYFDYCEDWQVFPIEDSTQYYWALDGEGPGTVMFADTETELQAASGNFYSDQIYTYRNLSKWVYRGEMYTMIVTDTQIDGNKFLRIFDNTKERKLSMTKTNILIWEQLRKAGVADMHVADLVRQHISALEKLPDETPDKIDALGRSREYAEHIQVLKPLPTT